MSWRGPDYPAMLDEALAAKFRTDNDELAYGELWRRHRQMIFRACNAILRNPGLAEEVTQFTFMKAFEAKGRFDGGNYVAWLKTIAKRKCIDLLRGQEGNGRTESLDEADDAGRPRDIKAPLVDPVVQLQIDEMYKEMAMLPTLQRKCLERQLEGDSYKDIAAKLKITVDAVRSHIQNGMRTLKLRMNRKKELA